MWPNVIKAKLNSRQLLASRFPLLIWGSQMVLLGLSRCYSSAIEGQAILLMLRHTYFASKGFVYVPSLPLGTLCKYMVGIYFLHWKNRFVVMVPVGSHSQSCHGYPVHSALQAPSSHSSIVDESNIWDDCQIKFLVKYPKSFTISHRIKTCWQNSEMFSDYTFTQYKTKIYNTDFLQTTKMWNFAWKKLKMCLLDFYFVLHECLIRANI